MILYYFAIIFLAGSLCIYFLMRKNVRKVPVYACGEDIPTHKVASANFYRTFKVVLPKLYYYLYKLHDEDLTNYLTIILFIASIMVLGVIVWLIL